MQSGKQAPQLGGRRTSLGHLLSKAYIKGLDGLTLPLECSTCWSQLYSQSERVSFKHSILSTKIAFSRPSYCQTTIQWLPKWYQPWKDPCLFVGTMDTSLQLQSHMQCHQQKCNYSHLEILFNWQYVGLCKHFFRRKVKRKHKWLCSNGFVLINSPLWPLLHHLLFSGSVMSDFLRPHGLQHTRLPCPSPTSRTCSNSCPKVGDAIQPSHPLSSPSPLVFNLS